MAWIFTVCNLPLYQFVKSRWVASQFSRDEGEDTMYLTYFVPNLPIGFIFLENTITH